MKNRRTDRMISCQIIIYLISHRTVSILSKFVLLNGSLWLSIEALLRQVSCCVACSFERIREDLGLVYFSLSAHGVKKLPPFYFLRILGFFLEKGGERKTNLIVSREWVLFTSTPTTLLLLPLFDKKRRSLLRAVLIQYFLTSFVRSFLSCWNVSKKLKVKNP